MKQPDWARWFNGCYQTFVWLGTSIPSQSSQEKQLAPDKFKGYGNCQGKGQGKGKGLGKGKDKGKGKGQDKGKDKGKGKGKGKGAAS